MALLSHAPGLRNCGIDLPFCVRGSRVKSLLPTQGFRLDRASDFKRAPSPSISACFLA